MDMNRFTSPVTDHLPTGAATTLASKFADATTGLAGQIGDHAGQVAGQVAEHVGDLDVSGTVRRGRRLAARYVPGISAPRRSVTLRHWLMIAVAILAVGAAVVTARRRSSSDPHAPSRDDWSTAPSSNGASNPSADREHEPAATGA